MKTQIENFLGGLNVEIDVLDFANIREIETLIKQDDSEAAAEQLRDAIEDGQGFEIDVIYYYKALEYLQENDSSLQISTGLAADMGFTAENINSELLASLLASQNARDEYDGIEDEIEYFFEELANEYQEEEETI